MKLGSRTATVVGDWAQTNQVYHQEAVVRSTWKITSSCYTAQDCTGQVVSDQRSFYDDGTHLRPAGAAAYAAFIQSALG